MEDIKEKVEEVKVDEIDKEKLEKLEEAYQDTVEEHEARIKAVEEAKEANAKEWFYDNAEKAGEEKPEE